MVTAMPSVALPAVVLASVSAESCFVIGVVTEGLSTDLDKRVSDDLVTEEATEDVNNPKIEEKDDMIVGGLYVGWIDNSMRYWRLLDYLADALDELTFEFQNSTMAT